MKDKNIIGELTELKLNYSIIYAWAHICIDIYKSENLEIGKKYKLIPVEDICECTEFQSCEKCAIKTEWLPIELNKMARGGEYWFKDADNNTCMGIANKNINLYPRTSSGEMGCPTEYAEIKPPKVTTQ